MDVSPKCYFFVSVTLSGWSEYPKRAYRWKDVVAYQLINLNWKLSRSGEECINIVPYGSYTTLAVRKGLILMIFSFDYHWNCKGKIAAGHSWDVKTVKTIRGPICVWLKLYLHPKGDRSSNLSPAQHRRQLFVSIPIRGLTLLIDPTAMPCWWAPTRAKQLSMAATARVIWLCACVRYWPYRGVGRCAPLPSVDICLFVCLSFIFFIVLIFLQAQP